MPTLWIGTSLGSVLTVAITLPDPDSRKTSPVVVTILGKWRKRSLNKFHELQLKFVPLPRWSLVPVKGLDNVLGLPGQHRRPHTQLL